MSHLYKRIVFFTSLLFFSGIVFSQDSVFPWKVSSKKISDGKYELTFSTAPSAQWELYAPAQKIDLPTTELQFSDSSIAQEGKFLEKGEVKEIKHPLFEEGTLRAYQSPAEWTATIQFKDKDSIPAVLQGKLLYTYGQSVDTAFYPSAEFVFTVAMEGGIETAARIRVASIDINNPVNNCGDEGTKNKSIFSIFLLGLLGGLIALLTPCVFPMIPVTVTFFTKKSQRKGQGITNAVLYGLFIFLIYILITVPFHIAGNTSPEIFNNISTNVWLNLLFFAIFVFFALSFFGLFEIGLPSGLANKADSKSGLGNIGGIFFMAATLAIVSFSCTGPILGTLLVGVAEQGGLAIDGRGCRFWPGAGITFCLVCHVSALAAIITQIRRLDDGCKSGAGIPGTGPGHQVFFKRGSCQAVGFIKTRNIYRFMDRDRGAYRFILIG